MGLNIESSIFFCSSLEGLGIPTGVNFIDFIRDKLRGCKIVISLISNNYFDSGFCLCELGASWILSRTHYPIVVPPFKIADMQGILQNIQARIINSDRDLNEIKDELIQKLELKYVKSARWESKKDQFLDKLPIILAKLPKHTKIAIQQFEGLKDKYDDSVSESKTK